MLVSLSMKTTLFFITFIFSLHSFALAPGMCETDPGSKKYLNFPQGISFPKLFVFTCDYECADRNGEISKVTATTTVKVGQENPRALLHITNKNMEAEAKQVVCEGVKVKKVPWGWEFDKVIPIYSKSSNTSKLKLWASENINSNNPREIGLLRELKEKLSQSAKSFLMAGGGQAQFLYFKEAGALLTQIHTALPNDTSFLDSTIHECKQGNYQGMTKLGLVCGQLNLLDKWRY